MTKVEINADGRYVSIDHAPVRQPALEGAPAMPDETVGSLVAQAVQLWREVQSPLRTDGGRTDLYP